MKSLKFLYFLLTVVLLGSCTQDESNGVVKNGVPVRVNLSFALADVEYPEVSVASANSSATENAKGSSAGTSVARSSSSKVPSSSTESSPLQVSYAIPDKSIKLRAATALSNVWVLQFDSTGVIGAANACVAAQYIGTVTSETTQLSPTLISGTGQVVYVIANGPASGITTTTYTLSTFKSSAAFSGTITDASTPYVGRVPGAATITSTGISGVSSVKLYRIAAKISLTLKFAVTGYTLSSVVMYNKPISMYYVNGSDVAVFPATPTASDINISGMTADVTPTTSAAGTYVWYTGENKRGTGSATTSYNKDASHTPSSSTYCTYIRIKATKTSDSNTYYYYDLYVGANNTTDFNVKRNWDYSINVVIGGDETTQDLYDGVDGRITKVVMKPANCYLVAPGGNITIPVNVKGNGDTYTSGLAGISISHTAASVGILWQTGSISLISSVVFNSSSQTATITAGSGEGNAVIAAYDTDGTTILWSWHIWITDQPANVTVNGNVWMDRNLGATARASNTSDTTFATCGGLMYQWGRKDPFPGSDGLTIGSLTDYSAAALSIYNTTSKMDNNSVTWPSTPTTTATSSTNDVVKYANASASPISYTYQCAYSIKYPLLFLLKWAGSTATTTATYTPEGGKDSWGGESGESKSIFDPCPSGWRVPSGRINSSTWSSPWMTWSTAQSYSNATYSALEWDANGTFYSYFYPISGCRYSENGSLMNVGYAGYYWSASLSSSSAGNGYTLFLSQNSVNTQNILALTSGRSVRCVQEW